jgi:predicted enzyme related to lactoylglutathione lyase
VVVEKTPVENVGTFGVVTDPTGAAIGLWQPAKKD